MASYYTYLSVGSFIPVSALLLLMILGEVIMSIRNKKQKSIDTRYVYKLPLTYQLMLKATYLGLDLSKLTNNSTQNGAPNINSATDYGTFSAVPRTAAAITTSTESETSNDIEEEQTEMQTSSDEYFIVLLHKYPMPKSISYFLAKVVMFVLMSSTLLLWQVLVIEETSNCGEDGYECFKVHKGNFKFDQFSVDRVTADCTIVNNGTAIQVNGTDHYLDCFRFTFNYLTAFSAAGGLTVFAGIMLNTFVFFAECLSKIRKHTHCVGAVTIVSVILFFLPFLALAIATYGSKVLRPKALTTVLAFRVLYIFVYAYSVVVIPMVAWAFRRRITRQDIVLDYSITQLPLSPNT